MNTIAPLPTSTQARLAWYDETIARKQAEAATLTRMHDSAQRHGSDTHIADALWSGRCALASEMSRMLQDREALAVQLERQRAVEVAA